MAYDDDGSKLRFRDFEDLAVLLERYLSAPENLTASRIIALCQVVHKIIAGRPPGKVEMNELAQGLRENGLAAIPFDTVLRVAEIVASVKSTEDVLAKLTLRDVQRIISR